MTAVLTPDKEAARLVEIYASRQRPSVVKRADDFDFGKFINDYKMPLIGGLAGTGLGALGGYLTAPRDDDENDGSASLRVATGALSGGAIGAGLGYVYDKLGPSKGDGPSLQEQIQKDREQLARGIAGAETGRTGGVVAEAVNDVVDKAKSLPELFGDMPIPLKALAVGGPTGLAVFNTLPHAARVFAPGRSTNVLDFAAGLGKMPESPMIKFFRSAVAENPAIAEHAVAAAYRGDTLTLRNQAGDVIGKVTPKFVQQVMIAGGEPNRSGFEFLRHLRTHDIHGNRVTGDALKWSDPRHILTKFVEGRIVKPSEPAALYSSKGPGPNGSPPEQFYPFGQNTKVYSPRAATAVGRAAADPAIRKVVNRGAYALSVLGIPLSIFMQSQANAARRAMESGVANVASYPGRFDNQTLARMILKNPKQKANLEALAATEGKTLSEYIQHILSK